jgi:hypothetical protein
MVNVIHQKPTWKIDLIFPAADAFQKSQFARRVVVPFAGKTVYVASPEDTIIAKLDWSRRGESERQFRDALGVYELQKKNVDMDYLRRWALVLGLEALLNRLEAESA